MLMPTTPCPLRPFSLSATATAPSLLNPSRLMTARSSFSLNTRGRGFPGCGLGVTPPISMNPNPAPSSGPIASPFLSKPAASPSGFGRSIPDRLTESPGEACTDAVGARPAFSARRDSRCAVSGSRHPRSPSPTRSVNRIRMVPTCVVFGEARTVPSDPPHP